MSGEDSACGSAWLRQAAGRGQGGDDALLVGGVGDGGWILAGNEQRGYFDGDGGAGEVVEGADGGVTGECGEIGLVRARPSWLARRRLWVTEAAWAVFQGMGRMRRSCRASSDGVQGGGEDVDAGAGGGGVEDDAGEGVGVVGDFGALVGGEGNGGVGVAGGRLTVKPAAARRVRRRGRRPG